MEDDICEEVINDKVTIEESIGLILDEELSEIAQKMLRCLIKNQMNNAKLSIYLMNTFNSIKFNRKYNFHPYPLIAYENNFGIFDYKNNDRETLIRNVISPVLISQKHTACPLIIGRTKDKKIYFNWHISYGDMQLFENIIIPNNLKIYLNDNSVELIGLNISNTDLFKKFGINLKYIYSLPQDLHIVNSNYLISEITFKNSKMTGDIKEESFYFDTCYFINNDILILYGLDNNENSCIWIKHGLFNENYDWLKIIIGTKFNRQDKIIDILTNYLVTKGFDKPLVLDDIIFELEQKQIQSKVEQLIKEPKLSKIRSIRKEIKNKKKTKKTKRSIHS